MPQFKFTDAAEAVEYIRSGQRVFIQGSASTPLLLTQALGQRAATLHQVEIVSLTTLGEMHLLHADYPSSFYLNSLFVSANTREAINNQKGDYIPVFLSEISRLFQENLLPLDIALVQVSPPDKHGFCSLGLSVDITRAAVRHARLVIAQMNPNMPRTLGDGLVHLNELDLIVEASHTIPEIDYSSESTVEDERIGRFCTELVEDGSTLQMGIGAIPDTVLKQLVNHKDLGVHTEMFSDGVIDLVNRGVITNRNKQKHRQKIVTTFAIGTRALYDFVDDNPQVAFLESDYVNDATIISRNPKVVAINSAIEIDLTGQVCADSIGQYQYSGVGGQMDFMRGAAISQGGKPIIAMQSRTRKGQPKIVPSLKSGASVVTTRAHVHYVITEFGVAYLFGKNLHQRAYALCDIAHPDDREWLESQTYLRFGPRRTQV